ncbi:hypothetical protein Bhyg_12971 [Pseudolycoriella hygida]|uniref:Uncharacterized protein n=1 Tax=Pseudolycoriella hygida TaxID=35572 RepID=A0A9Q0MYA4_9DIPT|nr:hypothetical protein Bhyg_12971 [Pseudolycoriella hygida]
MHKNRSLTQFVLTVLSSVKSNIYVVTMSKKSSRPSGAEKIREKNKLLLKAAGQSPNQKSLLDCFQKFSQVAKKELPINDELSNEPSAEVLTDNSLPKATDPDEVEVGNASCDQPFLIPKKDPLSVASFLHLHPIQPTTCPAI